MTNETVVENQDVTVKTKTYEVVGGETTIPLTEYKPRYKQSKEREYFFTDTFGDGLDVDKMCQFEETMWSIETGLEKVDGVIRYVSGRGKERDECFIKWFRNPFYVDDDDTKELNFENLYINSDGVVINNKDYDLLVGDGNLLPDFEVMYEEHMSISDGKLQQITKNYRNGKHKFVCHYKDGVRDGVFIFQNKDGRSVGGEYKDGKLVKTFSGLMTISTFN